jgi:cytochrome b6-f complex iron-sulfur subunit
MQPASEAGITGHGPGATALAGGPRRYNAHPLAVRRFSRRTFLRNAVLGGVGVAAAGVAAGAVAFSWPNETGVFGSQVVVPRGLVPAVGAPPLKHVAGHFLLINNPDGVLAMSWVCKHLGCTVPWLESEGQFHCPCHGSLYDRNGAVVRGPATAPLDLMELRVDPAGNLIVHTGRLTERESYTPEQAVKLTP